MAHADMDSSTERPTDRRNGVVVVGVDSSPCSRNAAEWAAAEAGCRSATLLLVHADLLLGAGEAEGAGVDEATTASQAGAAELLEDIAMQVRGAHPGVPVESRLVHADPVTALREASAAAVLTVVGSPGAGRIGDVILGSVAITIASNNLAPVAVIPTRRPGEGRGAVVVGVDESSTSEAALAFAFETAARWRAGLIAVHSWNDVRVDAAVPVHDMIIDKNAIDRDEQLELAVRLRVWLERFPGVPVQQAVVRGRPASSLIRFAPRARLIVVGSRGRGPFTGLLFGSTSQSLLAHAGCPVVVVRHLAGSTAMPPAME